MTNQSEPGARVSADRPIVVGVDGSEESKAALRWAARLAGPLGARLEVVSAWHVPVSYGMGGPTADWNPMQDITKCATEAVDEVFGPDRPAELEIVIENGGAAHVLIRHSRGAEMVVVGSRGHGGFAGLLLGSVSAAVAEHATCPVLVIHGENDPRVD
jgi:nucleotide-binding universal stress UspA family protein